MSFTMPFIGSSESSRDSFLDSIGEKLSIFCYFYSVIKLVHW